MARSGARDQLLRLRDVVKAYFEPTVAVAGDRWQQAFRSVRHNDEMARAFVDDVRRLIEHIDREFASSPGDQGHAVPDATPATVRCVPPLPPGTRRFGPASEEDIRTAVSLPPTFERSRPAATATSEDPTPEERGTRRKR